MKRRLLTSLGAATILATVLVATPLRVSADAGAQFQRSDDGGPEETAVDPCLPAKPNAVIGDTSSRDLYRRGFRRRPIPVLGRKGVLAFARTELFFGTDKPEGPPVSDDDFRGFLDSQITPRFPDGLTVVKGDGQFTDSEGNLIKEDVGPISHDELLDLYKKLEFFTAKSPKWFEPFVSPNRGIATE